MDKASSTFDLHGFCLLVQHVIFSNFLSKYYVSQCLRKGTTWLPKSFLGYAHCLKEDTVNFEMVFKASKSDLPILRYVNLHIRNYAQTLVECLPLFAYTKKRVLL